MKKVLYILFIAPLCVLSMLSMVYLFSQDEPLFFLRSVKVTGLDQLKDGDVLNRVAPFLKETLFGADVSRIRESVAAHPFVREASVRRVYPFSIVIDVKEKVPSALWVDGKGSIHVLDEQGEPYRDLGKGKTDGMFIISAKDKGAVKSLYSDAQTWIREGVMRREGISEIVSTDGNVTLFRAEDGVQIVLGKEDQKARLKKAIAVLEDAMKRGLLIRCIDARFEKGAIIQEKAG